MKTTKEQREQFKVLCMTVDPNVRVNHFRVLDYLDDLDELTARLEKAEGLLKDASELIGQVGGYNPDELCPPWLRAYEEWKKS